VSLPSVSNVTIRRAHGDDAAGIAAVLEVIAAERIYSAIDRAWSVDEERHYIESRSPREALFVAIDATGTIVGVQNIGLWSSELPSMSHVGHIGTFLLPAWRRHGLGGRLWKATLAFAGEAGYRKLVIYVRGSNSNAQAFYRGLGFVECGRLARQVTIDGVDDDEVLMERFL
jgi:ribosomal protein S18 acetylase RimI-like enzyme